MLSSSWFLIFSDLIRIAVAPINNAGLIFMTVAMGRDKNDRA